jgi:hypothetical protein
MPGQIEDIHDFEQIEDIHDLREIEDIHDLDGAVLIQGDKSRTSMIWTGTANLGHP